jgi:apolipoprotein N-acyltransferase
MIAVVTNDGWYGDSAGPYQHFFQVRIRAIEEGLPAIRSANTGISGIIDSYGRIVAKSELFEETALDAPLPLPLSPTLFAHTGNGLWLAVLLLIILFGAARSRRIAFKNPNL